MLCGLCDQPIRHEDDLTFYMGEECHSDCADDARHENELRKQKHKDEEEE